VSRKDREESRDSCERRRQRQQRKAAEREQALALAKREEAVQQALYRPKVTAKGRVDRFLEWHTAPQLLRGVQRDDAFLSVEHVTEEFLEVMRVVERTAPKLLEKDYVQALSWACRIPYVFKQPFVRAPVEWEPRGKGRDSIFRSLVEHLLARYRVSHVFWTVFFDRDSTHKYNLLPLVGHVAAGGSLVDYVSGKVPLPAVLPSERPFPEFPVPLTRKMCHDLLTMPSERSLVAAVRRIQVRSAGGSERLLQALLSSHHCQSLDTKDNEAFMQTVIDWLSKNAMLNPAEIAPLLDYIVHRRREDASFSMKSRSVVAMVRAMHAWHDGLAHTRSISRAVFRESGLRPITVSMHRKEKDGQVTPEVWRIRELLSARALADEGRRMNHCVYSYENSVAQGRVSIWSMTMEDGCGTTGNWAQLTIEVLNGTRSIVQARGRFNRIASAREHSVLAKWAQENHLAINLGRWG